MLGIILGFIWGALFMLIILSILNNAKITDLEAENEYLRSQLKRELNERNY